jgi:hypothetical protein
MGASYRQMADARGLHRRQSRSSSAVWLFAISNTSFVKGQLLFPLALGIGAGMEWNASMSNQDILSRHFQQKIAQFCEVRIAPIASKRVLENIRPYLISLIIYRKPPPLLNGRIDWTTITEARGIENEMTAELKRHLRPGLEAIIRWLDTPAAAQDVRLPKPGSFAGGGGILR